MMSSAIALRNRLLGLLYRGILKRIFFRFDPEFVHDRMIVIGKILGRFTVTRKATSVMFGYRNPVLEQTVNGIRFPNPIGLAAGFDKNAVLTDILPSVGFGFCEVGSITGEPCAGNPGKHLWRLPKSQSLVVYYGLKNDGCEAIAHRMRGKTLRGVVGISIAKTNNAETCETSAGVADYVKAFQAFADIGQYFTINISCPNAYGGEPFTEAKRLEALLSALDRVPTSKPIFLKLSPDLSVSELHAILDVSLQHRVAGFVCTNLTKKRDNPAICERVLPPYGGLSGVPVRDLSTAMIREIYQKTHGAKTIIGCGGVMSANDAYEKITAGASLIQMITGMIYKGPQVVSEINRGLVGLLKRDGFSNVSQAVGTSPTLTK